MALPRVHAAISTAVGLAAWAVTGKPAALPAALAGGFLIDGDHLFDYALRQLTGERERLILPLHGWEWAAVFWLVERRLFPFTGGAFTIAYLAHLAVDQITNGVR